MYASSSHLVVSRNSSLSACRFFFVNISRILLFRPFRNEAGDYFVNDSRREGPRPLIVRIFHLTRGFGTVRERRIRLGDSKSI